MFTLHNGDCLQYMRSMQSESVDCIITDPPYGINIKTGFNGDDKSISYDDGFSVMFFLDEYVKQWNRILKPNSAIYVFTRYDVMPYWWIRMKGCFDMKNCIVWSKGGGGTGDLKGNYIGTYEMILFGAKGRHILSGKRESNVWEYGKCKPDLHPMQKPVDLLSNIIFHSTKEGDVIFDPFSGSGQTGKAALMNGRSFIGCEIDERYYRLAQSGLEGIEPSTPSSNRLHWTGGDSPALPSQSTLEGFTAPEADTTPPASQ